MSSLVAVTLLPALLAAVPTAAAKDRVLVDDETSVAPAGPLLDGPARGSRAIRALGDELPVAAARNDMRPAELRTLLRTDETAWVDGEGQVYFVDPAPGASGSVTAAPTRQETAPVTQAVTESSVPALHSNPGASLTILLDFDGAYVAGTGWNASNGPGVTPAQHPAWDPAGNGHDFSPHERGMIEQVWAIVAEDYAPFNVNVTTVDPGEAGIVRSSSADTVYGTRVLITPSDDPHLKLCKRTCGGVAYVSVFDAVGTAHQPAWVFPQALGNQVKSVAEAATHEAGHNLGLGHDGTSTAAYYRGHGIWAPIMGVGYDRPLVQWSAGSYPGANNQQNDLTILTGYLRNRPDEASGSLVTPATLPTGIAYISTPTDVDAYRLGTCAAGSTVQVSPAALAPNLDVRAVLYDASGTQRQVAEPTSGAGNGTTASGLGATLTIPATGPGWVLTVDGAGQGTWAGNGYDDYGSLGAYTVSAPGCGPDVLDAAPGAPTNVGAAPGQSGSLTLSWSPPASGTVTGYVVSRSGSTSTQSLPTDARSHSFTGLADGTTYQLSVRAVNVVGPGPSAAVAATTSPPPPPSLTIIPGVTTGTPTTQPGPDPSAGAPRRMRAPRVVVRGGTVTVRWRAAVDNGSAVLGYLVDLSSRTRVADQATRGAASKVVLRRLKPGRYKVRVAARNASGTSPYSRWVEFRVRR